MRYRYYERLVMLLVNNHRKWLLVRSSPGRSWSGLDMRSNPPVRIRPAHSRQGHRRHQRKYAEGDLGEDISFYFRGPEDKLHLRAQNLNTFSQLAQGVDDATWLYHLRRGEYSRWFREVIKDEDLAKEAESIERDKQLSAQESRARIRSAIEKRYALSI